MKCVTYIRTSKALNLSKPFLTTSFDNLIQEYGWDNYKAIDVVSNPKQKINSQFNHDTKDKKYDFTFSKALSRTTKSTRLIARNFKVLLNERGGSL